MFKLLVFVCSFMILPSLSTTSVEYWDLQVKHDPNSLSAQVCWAIASLVSGGPKNLEYIMPILTNAVKIYPHDWVTFEYIGGVYGMLARKLAAVSPAEEAKALEAAVDAFEQAALHRPSYDLLKETDLTRYPQISFARPETLTLRSWGDALMWLGREEEARIVFAKGVASGYWRDARCRSEVEHPIIQASEQPAFFFRAEMFPHVLRPLQQLMPGLLKEFEDNTGVPPAAEFALLPAHERTRIAESFFLAVSKQRLAGGWAVEGAGLHSGSSWLQLPLLVDGRPTHACLLYPTACRALLAIPGLQVRKGQVKLSVMAPGTHVRPHAGPSNARLRMHCALLVPPLDRGGDGQSCMAAESCSTEAVRQHTSWLRVGPQHRTWREGACFAFDEACEHEVEIAPGAGLRVVLIADFVNPLLASASDYAASAREPDREYAFPWASHQADREEFLKTLGCSQNT